MLSQTMEKQLNKQVNAEFYSAYLYLAMEANFEDMNMPGMAAWMEAQAQEEITHGMKIFHYVIDRDGSVSLDKIDAPEGEWETPLEAFEAAYEHEQKVTSMINDLMSCARSEDDYAAENFLSWFVDEQVEEEESVDEVVQKLKRAQGAENALFMIDRELGQRGAEPETEA